MDDINFLANLTVLSMSKFDVIFCIDWLNEYCANSDCASKSIGSSIHESYSLNSSVTYRAMCF